MMRILPGIGCGLLAVGAAAPMQDVRTELESGKLAHALALSQELGDEGARAAWRVEILYRARDFLGCIEAAREVLEARPLDLDANRWATASALWLQDAGLARSTFDRLRTAVDAASFDDEELEGWWRSLLGAYEVDLTALEGRDAARRASESRAHVVALAGITAALTFLAWAAFGASSRRP